MTNTAKVTRLKGQMTTRAMRQLRLIAKQLRMTEAEAVSLALDRCGIHISASSTLMDRADFAWRGKR
jgi:ribosomal 50S subunit-associated protein YjgA (DUF615 family)